MTPKREDMQMLEQEYREYPALNFSKLAAYYNKGIYSPDHALIKIDFKSYFEYGKMFETRLQDAVKGTCEFEERFFQSKASGNMPDQLIQWIDEGEDLRQFYVYTKKGEPSGTYKTRHAFLDEAQGHPGKIPVSTEDWEMLKRHVDRMLKMEYLDTRVRDILEAAEWQVPIIWTDENGLEKKALIDCLAEVSDGFLACDIKTAAGFDRFRYMLRDKYWIQDIHYSEGVSYTKGVCMQMPFFVASKEAPCLCQPWTVDYDGPDAKAAAMEEYNQLCESFSKWNGKPKGWLPMTSTRLYLKNI